MPARKRSLHGQRSLLADFGYCSVCGRRLIDPVSVDRGAGPTCYQKLTSPNFEAPKKKPKAAKAPAAIEPLEGQLSLAMD